MKSQIKTDQAPSAEAILSQAISTNGLIFVSGQIAQRPNGEMLEGTTKQKLAQIIQNISGILEAAGTNIDCVVNVTIYVTDMTIMPDINKFYPTYFAKPYPARAAICVKELPLGANLEISVVATK